MNPDDLKEKEKKEEEEEEEVRVVRSAMTVEKRYQTYSYIAKPSISTGASLLQKTQQLCKCSAGRTKAWLRARIPILDWLPKYPIRSALVGDVIAGTTVAVMHIPQGMAYALLANLPPITGLYMAFFPVLVYVLLGTSRHVSMGTFAVACLMMGKVVNELSTTEFTGGAEVGDNNVTITDDVSNNTAVYTGQEVAAVVALTVGIWEVLLGVLQLGAVLNVFLSDMLVSGFTTGVAFHVLTSQIKYLFGISITSYNGPLKIIYTFVEIFRNILSTNLMVLLISLVCIILLVFNNEMKPRVKKYTTLPIPIELMAVVLGTLASYLANLNQSYDVRVVGYIPTGLPSPSAPAVTLLPRVAVDSFIIGVVGYTSTFSMSKIFAKRHGYAVDATQELYAHGLSNVFGSFFSCGPMAASLSRSLIQEAVGGVTLLTPFISCCLILLILLFIGPLFQALPNCVLSSIIVVSLKGLLLQFNDMRALWSVSKPDALIWIVTFGVSVVIDIDYGLAAGVVTSMLVILVRSQRPPTASLGRIQDTDLYLDVSKYPKASTLPGLRIFRFGGSLHFANAAFFRDTLLSKTGLESNLTRSRDEGRMNAQAEEKLNGVKEPKTDWTKPTAYENELTKDVIKEEKEKNNDATDVEKKEVKENDREEASFIEAQEMKEMHGDEAVAAASTVIPIQDVEWVVVDLGATSFIDVTGAKQLTQLHQELEELGIKLSIAAASDTVMGSLDRCGVVKSLGKSSFFHSIDDAVAIIGQKQKKASLNPPYIDYSTNL